MNIFILSRLFYNEYAIYINFFIIVAYLLLIYYVYTRNIKGFLYSFLALFLVGVVIVIGWYFGIHKLKSLRQKSCLITMDGRNTTQMNGLLYNGCLDFWHISHVLLWMLVGLFTPHHYGKALLISIGWEIIEHNQFSNDGSCISPVCARFEDLFLNMFGYTVGSFLSKK